MSRLHLEPADSSRRHDNRDDGRPSTDFAADVLAGLELVGWPHFLCWRPEQRNGDWTKPPVNPHTGDYASSTDPTTWAPFDVAVRRAQAEGWGLGFVFSATLNPFAGIDLDACRDPQTGLLVPWAQSIVAAFDSYAEVSPSQTGVKIIVRGKPRKNGKKSGAGGTAVEVYGHARYFTLTGWAL